MNSETLTVSNSNLMLLVCAIPIILVTVQAFLFLSKALKRADELGISKETRKKVIETSAVFSIVPSLPIIIVLAVLMPTLGKFLPWLRLSVIGSAMYENMAADLTVKGFGLSGIADSGMTPSIFVSVAWVMTLGAVSWPLINILFLKGYDKGLKKMEKKGGFMVVAVGSLFVGMMAVLGIPHLVNFQNMVGITSVIIAGIFVLLLDKISGKSGIAWLKDFSFPLSMVIGMVSAIPLSLLFA